MALLIAFSNVEEFDNPELSNHHSVLRDTFVYRGKAIYLDRHDYGFRMELPQDALTCDTTECLIQIEVALSCEYTLPKDAELVSGVYSIHSPQSFTKPVKIEIQHYSLDTESLFFGVDSHHQQPCEFKALDDGQFNKEPFGVIYVKSFSIFGIFRRLSRNSVQANRYLSSLFYGKVSLRQWSVYFVIVKDTELYKKLIRKYFKDENINLEESRSISQSVKFANNVIRLDVSRPNNLRDGWTLCSATSSLVITKDDVDHFSSGRFPPMCQLHLRCSTNTSTDLDCRLLLIGTEVPQNFFHMIMSVDTVSHDPDSRPTLPHIISFPLSDGNTLNLTQEVGDKYRSLGILLLNDRRGARITAISGQHNGNSEHINLKVFRLWLNGEGKQPVSWGTLITVLKDIQLNTLADILLRELNMH